MANEQGGIQAFKELLNHYGIRPERNLGQNFLWDKALLVKMTDEALLQPVVQVLEIGSGAGTLTEVLAGKAEKVVSLEIDPTLQPLLQDLALRKPNIHFHFGDATKLDLSKLFTEEEKREVQIMANLPYYLTSELIRQCLCQLPQASRMTFLVQKDVVPRLRGTAGDGKSQSKNQGSLAKLIACYGDVKLVRTLPAGNFYPVPGVDSELVYFAKREGTEAYAMLEEHPAILVKTIDQAFSQRRKTLINCMGEAKKETEAWLVRKELPLTTRAEELQPEDFASLAKQVYLGR